MSLILARNCKVRLTLNCHCAKCPVSSHILRDWIFPNTIYKYLFLNQQWQCYLWQLSSQQLSFTHPHTYTRVPTVCMCTLICIKSDLSLLFSYPSHLRTLEADIKGQILPPIFRLTSETLPVTLWHSRGLVVLWSETCDVQGRQDQKQGITAPGKGMLLDF